MGNGCFVCCKKVTPQPVSVVIPTVVTEPVIVPKEKPYGYVRLFAGVKTNDNKYTSPVIALHTYVKARKVTTQTKTTMNVTNSKTGRSSGYMSHSGPSSSTNTDKQETEEKVRCIPIEDIISIEYSTDVKKEYETLETRQERRREPKAKLGCCGRVKECLLETFWRCSCCPCYPCCPCDPCCPCCKCGFCQALPDEKPQYDSNTRRNVIANRMILIEMKCIHHSNINIPTHVQVLPDDEKSKFYTENFKVDTIYFYLVNNNEAEHNDFQKKSHDAEKLTRTIVQLRNMANHYPSQIELVEILKQQQTALFGDEIIE